MIIVAVPGLAEIMYQVSQHLLRYAIPVHFLRPPLQSLCHRDVTLPQPTSNKELDYICQQSIEHLDGLVARLLPPIFHDLDQRLPSHSMKQPGGELDGVPCTAVVVGI